MVKKIKLYGGIYMNIGGYDFSLREGFPYLMGILNVTPDSFSDGGKYLDTDAALRHAEKLCRDGADIIDIGAESTRPGYQPVSEEEEKERLCRVIELLKKEVDRPISVDTYKARVMDAALEAGGDIANDIWGFRYEEMHPEEEYTVTMAEVVAKHGTPVVLMHNDLMGRDEQNRTREMVIKSGVSHETFIDPVCRVREGLDHSLEIAGKAGISRENIILDPGIGFAKSNRESLKILNSLISIKKEGEMWLLATSRKSVIGDVLDLPVDQREEGTLVTSILAAEAGFAFVRVHEITPNLRGLKMYHAIHHA